MFSNDARQRCDLVDLYFVLYGLKRPVCLPVSELSAMMNMSKNDARKAKQYAQKQQMLASAAATATHTSSTASVDSKRGIQPPPLARDSPTAHSNVIVDAIVDPMNVDILSTDKIKVSVPFSFLLFTYNNNALQLRQVEPMDVEMESQMVPVKQDYFSDNSVSLPGMGLTGPVGFEPGMFKDSDKSKDKESSSGKVRIN